MIPLAPPAASLLHPGYVAGRRYPAANASPQNIAVTANRLNVVAHEIRAPITVSGIGLNVSTGAAGLAKAGIYRFNADGGISLIAECNADMDTTAAAQISASFSANFTLNPGVYAVATCFNAAPTVTCQSNSVFGAVAFQGATSYSAALVAGSLVSGAFVALTYVSGPTAFFPATVATGSLSLSGSGFPIAALLAA